jgi:hypothetical protein
MSEKNLMRSEHPLFARHPLDNTIEIDGETLSTPYHIYNGELLLIGGRADAAVAAALLAGERLTPVLDSDGNALMALWVANFTEANLGPHHELQVSLFAALQPQAPEPRHPFAIHRLLVRNPNAYMICHGLWNNTARVVRYNQSHLRLDARLSASRIDHDAGVQRLTFQVDDAERGQPVAAGTLAAPARQSPAVMWAMLHHLGVHGFAQSVRTPFLHVPVVNTHSLYADDNEVAHTYTRSDRQIVRRYGEGDHITIQHDRYAQLNFRPDFVQHNIGIRFVYLRPQMIESQT